MLIDDAPRLIRLSLGGAVRAAPVQRAEVVMTNSSRERHRRIREEIPGGALIAPAAPVLRLPATAKQALRHVQSGRSFVDTFVSSLLCETSTTADGGNGVGFSLDRLRFWGEPVIQNGLFFFSF